MTQDQLEHAADAQVVAMPLVVIDVTARQRRLIQMPDERLLGEIQLLEAIGIELDDGGVVNLLEQVAPIVFYSGRSAF